MITCPREFLYRHQSRIVGGIVHDRLSGNQVASSIWQETNVIVRDIAAVPNSYPAGYRRNTKIAGPRALEWLAGSQALNWKTGLN